MRIDIILNLIILSYLLFFLTNFIKCFIQPVPFNFRIGQTKPQTSRFTKKPSQNSGFLLLVEEMSDTTSGQVSGMIKERTPAEKLYDRLFTPALVWSYQIKVVDIDSKTAFDQLTIRLKRQQYPETGQRDGLLNSAFRYVAAKLAGQA